MVQENLLVTYYAHFNEDSAHARMKKLQIVRIENDLVQKANLQIGNNIISSGSATEDNNKQIKNAVTINLSPSGSMTLTPCQVCYIKSTGSSRWQLLKLGTTVPVKSGDICSLLSNKCWFKIMTVPDTMEKDDHLLKRKCKEELASEPPDKKVCLDASPKLITSHGDSSNEFQENKDSKPAIAEKTVSSSGDSVDASTFSKNTNISSLVNNESIPSPMSVIEDSNLLGKPKFIAQENQNIKEKDTKDDKNNVKEEHAMDLSNNGESHNSMQQDTPSSSVIKQNEAGVSNDRQTENRRNRCIYAGKCYRKNPYHKVQFSHPGDPDFDVIDERPECPYGIHCYRKNLQHKTKFKHTAVLSRRAPTPVRSKNVADESMEESLSEEEESVDESEYEPSVHSDYGSDESNTDWDDAEND